MTSLRGFRWTPFALVVVLAALLAAPSAGAALRDNGDGTFTDSATALTWVADPDFAATAGFGPGAGHAEAIALVRAMNAGEVENFGRTDWRLPTARERATLEAPPAGGDDGRRRFAASSRTGPGLAELRPVSGSALVNGIADATIVATNSLLLSREVRVVGDVVVNEAGSEPLVVPGWEVAIDRDARVEGDLAGDRVTLARGVTVTGNVASNVLAADKATLGSTSSPLSLPVFSMLPPFEASVARDGTVAVSVAPGDTVELPAGHYLDVLVADGGTLILAGGQYHVGGLDVGEGGSVLFRAAASLRLRDRLHTARAAQIGPEDGSGLSAADAIVYVGGVDGADGVLGSLPRAVEIEQEGTIRINLYAPDGTVQLFQNTSYEGAILARDLLVDRHCDLMLASFWANRPPVAHAQTVNTSGGVSIEIFLTGSDPEGEDLSFAIVDPPAFGSLSTPTPIVPPVEIDPVSGDPVQPSTTSASVTYTPAGSDDVEDAFTFSVTDPLGSFGTAVVTINPPIADEPPPPPPETVVAADLSATVREGAAGILGLTAGAPDGVALTYGVIAGTGPVNGTLGAIEPGLETPVRTAAASYTPNVGFTGSDGFDFEVCGTVDSVLVCDQAAYAIEVVASPVETGELAADRQVAAVEDVPLIIDLVSGSTQSQAEESSVAGTLRVITGEAVGIFSAAVAGNVADSGGDGLGDEHNALPGPAPGLISAGVGLSGGAGSNGTVRVHVEYDVSFLAGFIGDVVGAQVVLTTHRGTVDALDTGFWWIGDEGNGTLEASDFERPGEALGVTMPVPPSQAIGEDGSFGFSVLSVLRAAVAAGHEFLTIQGRVDESLLGPARGLQVYSTASGNLTSFKAPALSFSTPPPLPPTLLVTIISLPQFGTLLTPGGQPIVEVPTSLSSTLVTYVPNAGFLGTDSFSYEVTDFVSIDTGLVTVVVQAGSCAKSAGDCDDGR